MRTMEALSCEVLRCGGGLALIKRGGSGKFGMDLCRGKGPLIERSAGFCSTYSRQLVRGRAAR